MPGDRKTIVYTKSRNQMHIILDPKLVKLSGFEAGEDVHVLYDKNRIIIKKQTLEEQDNFEENDRLEDDSTIFSGEKKLLS